MGKITAVITISHFRGRNDNGSETTATWIAAVDTDFGQAVDTNFRVRLAVEETAGGGVNNPDLHFQYRHLEGTNAWTDITTTSSVVRAFGSANFTHADDTTQQISAFSFITPNEGMTDTGEVITTADPSSSGIEIEGCFQIRSADVTAGDSIEMRCTIDTAAPGGTPVLPMITAYAPLTVSCTTEALKVTEAQATITKIVPRVVTCTTEAIELAVSQQAVGGSFSANYRIDGHIQIVDFLNQWAGDANAFDDSVTTNASTSANDAILSGKGVNLTGDEIGTITEVLWQIRWTVSSIGATGNVASVALYDGVTSLGSFQTITDTGVAVWTTQTAPSAPAGGWTWDNLLTLEAKAHIITGGS